MVLWGATKPGTYRRSCVLPATFAGEHLERLRAAWRRAQRPFRESWLAKRSASGSDAGGATYFDVPAAQLYGGLGAQLEAGAAADDAVLLDLVDPPPLMALLGRLLVRDQWTQLRMGGLFQPRTVPVDPGGAAGGYIGWVRPASSTPAATLAAALTGGRRGAAPRP